MYISHLKHFLSVDRVKLFVVVSVTGHQTSDHWLVWVRGVVVSVTGHKTSDHWL